MKVKKINDQSEKLWRMTAYIITYIGIAFKNKLLPSARILFIFLIGYNPILINLTTGLQCHMILNAEHPKKIPQNKLMKIPHKSVLIK